MMTDKSSVKLGAIGQVHPKAIGLLCNFHRSQAWERWVNKNSNGVSPHDREQFSMTSKNWATQKQVCNKYQHSSFLMACHVYTIAWFYICLRANCMCRLSLANCAHAIISVQILLFVVVYVQDVYSVHVYAVCVQIQLFVIQLFLVETQRPAYM